MKNSGLKTLAVIPARFGSTRFPGKPLASICGRPMIWWTYQRTKAATMVSDVVVATDDVRIFDCVKEFGGRAIMTSPKHETGTDRVAEAICGSEADLILNVQGDEPLIPSTVINNLIKSMSERTETVMGTIARPIAHDDPGFLNNNVVKCVLDANGDALYFSRAPIPFAKDIHPENPPPLHHWGIYAFRRDFLNQFVKWPRSPLECCEHLEQLRALEHGVKIFVLVTGERTIKVDVPDDIFLAEEFIRSKGFC
jgi:3-deoxy-manno-octulosonate cytidylyltransferase (CMP-KDO synthetase)